MSKLLKEAIADAKAVRETALANARLALEEAFAPRLQSMLTKKLKEEELEMDSEEEVSDEVDEGSYSEDDEEVELEDEVEVADEAPEAEEELEDEESEEEVSDEVVEDELEAEEGDAEEVHDIEDSLEDEDEVEESAFDLESIIKELESELEEGSYSEDDEESEEIEEKAGCYSEDDEEEEAVEEQSDSSEIGKSDNHVDVADCEDCEDPQGSSLTEDEDSEEETEDSEEETEETEETEEIDEEIDLEIVEEESEEDESEETEEESEEELEEEINIEEILKELEQDSIEEEAKEATSEEIAGLKDANDKLQKENDEYRKVYKFLRGKLNEVNLLNAKLLYTNKLFKAHVLNEDQKLKVVESFDLTKNVREAKLVYATLGESFKAQAVEEVKEEPKPVKAEKNPLTEGIASKAIKSTKPSKKILSEGNDLADRFKKLAGIKG